MVASNKPGFSLIEIMIVVMIIAVLMALALGGMRWLQRAKLTATETKLTALDSMLELYDSRIGEFPSDLRELIDGPSKPALQKKWAEAIAHEDDLTDSW